MTAGGSVCRHGQADPVPPLPAANGPDPNGLDANGLDANGPAGWRLAGGPPA